MAGANGPEVWFLDRVVRGSLNERILLVERRQLCRLRSVVEGRRTHPPTALKVAGIPFWWYLPPQSTQPQPSSNVLRTNKSSRTTWRAAPPFAHEREDGNTLLVLEDPGGQPLSSLIGSSMEMGLFLRLAVALSTAIGPFTPTRSDSQRRQTREFPRQFRDRKGLSDGFWDCFAPHVRTPVGPADQHHGTMGGNPAVPYNAAKTTLDPLIERPERPKSFG
jgi:hypothetical protein